MSTSESLIDALRSRYPSLTDLAVPAFAAQLQRQMQLIDAEPGDRLLEEGKPCIGFPLVLQGEICVSKSSAESGRTMELYRVGPGEICVVSAASLLAALGVIGLSGYLGIVPLVTGVFRFCPAYRLVGLSTCPLASKVS
ncbi:MAG TPA: YgaP-like transmembrane domain [Steroidobacteraceae bacterium]|nr:YgaP-like transmembrane domain [Steroidobacteraceae bacterium]